MQNDNMNHRGFADFEFLFNSLAILGSIDSVIFILIPVSFMKQLITWLPNTFKTTTDLLLTYLNKHQLVLWIFSLYATFAVAMFNKFIMSTSMYKIGSEWYAMLRTLIFNLNGFFWEPSVVFGIREDV